MGDIMATSEAQKKALKKYDAKQSTKEKRRVYVARSTAKRFIKDMASPEDLEELSELIKQRRDYLK